MAIDQIHGIGLGRRGWTARVDDDFSPNCWVCKKPIDVGSDFWYCKNKNLYWCYYDRAKEWPKECDYSDEHNHYCIRFLEVSKNENKQEQDLD
jgi:hypothetical protein